jgi:hypothetical protein
MKMYIHKGECGYIVSTAPLGADVELDLPSAWADILSAAQRIYEDIQDYLGVIYNAKRNN